ncbi:hypothetical protein TcWFU_008335 [Taenia crassiceps]|uniref:Uncharacterized protein n=1 Tax=Taenia crassiceps TaxID=6207 RepID=A0ABR4PYW0_9CEST
MRLTGKQPTSWNNGCCCLPCAHTSTPLHMAHVSSVLHTDDVDAAKEVGLTSFLSPAPASPHQISMSCSWCTIRASLNAHLTALSIAELSSEWWSFKAPPQNEVNVDIWNPAICLLFPLVEKALAVERAKQCLGMLPALSFIIVF